KKIKAEKPKEKPHRLTDGGGLSFAVAEGKKTWWRFDYRFEGKQKTISLGTYPEVSLGEARDFRDDARRLLKAGKDPSAERKAERAKNMPDPNAKTFKDAADGYQQLLDKKERSEKTKARDTRMIGYLVRAFGSKPIAEVTATDLTKLLDTFEEAGS